MSKKLEFLTHLSAVQGTGEKRPEPYAPYGEDVSQTSNAVMRQEQPQAGRLRPSAGSCGE